MRTPSPGKADPEGTSTSDRRRQDLMRAAFEAIAAEGFEGLRTRSVAARAGVNIATLHYYFPTKEALIGGVAQHLTAQFISLHGPEPAPSGSAALDRLRQEFSDTRFYRANHAGLLTVMAELQLRARRDEAIAQIIAPLLGHWRDSLVDVIRAGIEEGVFRARIDPAAAGLVLMTAFAGTTIYAISAEAMENIFEEIESWLVAGSEEVKAASKQTQKSTRKT
jgi:TetR/AcrR family transcriptional regulator, regulator of cefoperazone and chloramphenicol sensitivity